MTQISNNDFSKFSTEKKYLDNSANTIVIIDGSVDDLKVLKAGFEPGAEVVVLHPQLNGIEQISTLVSRRKNLQKVHLISHGSSASLKLGACELNLDNINNYATEIETWFANSYEDTSLFIYGCQVAAERKGENFVQRLSELTGANIAAATQTVGSPMRGGVWQLNYTVGAIEPEIVLNEETLQVYSGIFEELLEQEQEPVGEEKDDVSVADADTVVEPVDGIPAAEASVEPADAPVAEPLVAGVDVPIIESSIADADTDVSTTNASVVEDAPVADADTSVESTIEPATETPVDALVDNTTATDANASEEAIANASVVDNDSVEDANTTVEATADVSTIADLPVEDLDITVEPTADVPVVEQPAVKPLALEETTVAPANINANVINLSDLAGGEIVSTTFSVSSEAGYDNTVDFYEVNADGSVIDPDSGTAIAVGDAGYTEAALANRVGLELSAENGEAEFFTELEGGKTYAPIIAVDSGFEAALDSDPANDPTIYFAYSDANADGFEHVRSSEPNVFEFEDLPDGGDTDFDDMVVSVSLDNTPVTGTLIEPVEGTSAIAPTANDADASLVVEPIDGTAATIPVDTEPVVEPVGGTPAIATPIAEDNDIELIDETAATESTVVESEVTLTEPTVSKVDTDTMAESIEEISTEPAVTEDVDANTVAKLINETLATDADTVAESIEKTPAEPAVTELVEDTDADTVAESIDETLATDADTVAESIEKTPAEPAVTELVEDTDADTVAESIEKTPAEPAVTELVENTDTDTVAESVEETPTEPTVSEDVDADTVVESIDETLATDAESVVDSAATQVSDDSSSFNLDGTELQFQIVSPDSMGTTAAPTIALNSNESEFDSDGIQVDIAGGVAGDLSLSLAVDENRVTTSTDTLDFSKFVLSDISDNLPVIEDVSLNEAATTLGLDASDISFTEDTIEVNLEGTSFDPGATALLDIDIAEV